MLCDGKLHGDKSTSLRHMEIHGLVKIFNQGAGGGGLGGVINDEERYVCMLMDMENKNICKDNYHVQ